MVGRGVKSLVSITTGGVDVTSTVTGGGVEVAIDVRTETGGVIVLQGCFMVVILVCVIVVVL